MRSAEQTERAAGSTAPLLWTVIQGGLAAGRTEHPLYNDYLRAVIGVIFCYDINIIHYQVVRRPVQSAQEGDDNWGMREEWNESVDRHSLAESPLTRILIYRR